MTPRQGLIDLAREWYEDPNARSLVELLAEVQAAGRAEGCATPTVTPDPAEKELDVETDRALDFAKRCGFVSSLEGTPGWRRVHEDDLTKAFLAYGAALLSDRAQLVAERDEARQKFELEHSEKEDVLNDLATAQTGLDVYRAWVDAAEAEAARLEGEVARLREQLDEYAVHKHDCASRVDDFDSWKRCDCGLSLALTESSPSTKKIEHVNLQARLDQDTDLKLRLKEHARRFPDTSPSTEGEPT